jgi:hypothetical protein
MVTPNRSEAKAAFDNILNEVLGRDDNSNVKRGLLAEGIADIFDLSSLDDGFIDDLEYPGPKTQTSLYHVYKVIRCLSSVLTHFPSLKRPLTSLGLVQPTKHLVSLSQQCQLPLSEIHPHLHHMTLHPPKWFAARSKLIPLFFLYFMISDIVLLKLKRAQDVSEVLDSTYTPVTQDEINLFTEKHKFLYAVLESKVLTDRVKAIIRDHEDDFNAQKVYQNLKTHHLTSTKAIIVYSTILAYIHELSESSPAI